MATMQFLKENITRILIVLYVWHRCFEQNISRFSKMCFRKLHFKRLYLRLKCKRLSLNTSISAIILYCMLHSEFRGYFAVYILAAARVSTALVTFILDQLV